MELLILILATWRITSLLNREHGPWDVLGRWRHLIGVRVNDVGETYGTNELARGLVCVWCVSVWIGVGWAVLHYFQPQIAFWLALPLALSAGAIVIDNMVND